jgi:hypothetical protein
MPSQPQHPKQTRPTRDGRPGVDESIIRALRDLYSRLAPLEAVRAHQQDFEAIWIIRSEIGKLEAKAGEQAKRFEEEVKQRERKEQEASDKADREAIDAQSRQDTLDAALRAQEKRNSEAWRLIEQECLILCSHCMRGVVEIECPTCRGLGYGDPRIIDESVPAVCSNLLPTCSICAGTGVFTALRKKTVRECSQCSGTGDAKVSCPSCRGGQIVNLLGEPITPPPEFSSLVLTLLSTTTR